MWSSDFLWRYPAAPPSPLAELKTQLPTQLSSDPRAWGRDEVVVFLRWTEREFDLPKFELDLFQMNGKALCLLTKNDLAERCPGAGDIIHNVLQLLIRDAQMLQRPFRTDLPSSPITPTNRYPLSPHSHPPTPNWNSLMPPNSDSFYASHLQHFMTSNSVTLSPAPSIDSQAGSPPGQEAPVNMFSSNGTSDGAQASTSSDSPSDARSSSASGNSANAGNSSRSSSNHSDSEEESNSFKHKIPKLLPPPMHHKQHQQHQQHQQQQHQKQSPPVTPIFKESSSTTPSLLSHQLGDFKQHSIFFNGALDAVNTSGSSSSASPSTPTTPGYLSVKREFFPDTPTEPNTSELMMA
jgi:ETS translocation variant 6/7